MDVSTSLTYADARGYTEWTDATPEEQTQALTRAADYITANYALRPELTEAEQDRYDAAQFLIAYDIRTTGGASARAERLIAKEKKEGAGFKKEVEYADAPLDPYPQATALLAPLSASAGVSGVLFGKLVRR